MREVSCAGASERQPADFSPRQHVRAATRAAHARVDGLFGAFDLADPADYRRFLEAHGSVTPSCERALSASGAAELLADWDRRARAPSLAADLADLGGASIGIPSPTRRLTPAQAFGMMYVLEGSRLGGAVLARRVLASPSAACRSATRYLRHGEGQRLWSAFVAAFDNSPVVRDALDDVVRGALAAFDLFEKAAETSRAILPREKSTY